MTTCWRSFSAAPTSSQSRDQERVYRTRPRTRQRAIEHVEKISRYRAMRRARRSSVTDLPYRSSFDARQPACALQLTGLRYCGAVQMLRKTCSRSLRERQLADRDASSAAPRAVAEFGVVADPIMTARFAADDARLQAALHAPAASACQSRERFAGLRRPARRRDPLSACERPQRLGPSM